MPISQLQARLRLAGRFKTDASPGDQVLLEFVPDTQDQQMREWAATPAAGTGVQYPITLQLRVTSEIAKEAFTAPGEEYTLTIERARRGQ